MAAATSAWTSTTRPIICAAPTRSTSRNWASTSTTRCALIAQQASTVDSLRVAVLAALNIADELHVLRRKYDSIASDYNERAEHLAGALDEVLQEGRRAG